uniref:SPOR domain-containing protein n=1 Tax=uncultured Altererythrobacter sp. TaxID=500840 RepID=UPI0026108806|nr:SPOR domain-containing protein [uncultured Altererythrobacter sp.]
MAVLTYLRVLAVAALPVLAVPANAQQSSSREVSQALPSAEVQALRNALQRLARQPQSAQALVDAGDASLALNDYSAAEGFYARALQLSPNSAAAKLGLASVYLKTRQPVEALQMFAEAERAGASVDAILGDWGLAQDLVGNNELAQQSYRTFLARGNDDEVTRRLAISLAIAGQRDEFEAALRPLLARQDLAAFRARAFGLAILGDTDQAARLANQLLPPDLSSRMAPYFEFMPRLTKSQQAAAANLGIFPRAAQIGRDDPQMASLGRGEDPRMARVDERLAPRGAPLGTRVDNSPPEPSGESRLARIAREQASVADAFSGFIAPEELPAATSDGAVDISTIEIPREQSKPEPPQHPSRHWVQMATGRDIGALRFDWRRMMRRAPELLDGREAYTTRWGQANRLLTGPFASRDDARQLVRDLRRQGFDSFSYTSPEGEKIDIIQ